MGSSPCQCKVSVYGILLVLHDVLIAEGTLVADGQDRSLPAVTAVQHVATGFGSRRSHLLQAGPVIALLFCSAI